MEIQNGIPSTENIRFTPTSTIFQDNTTTKENRVFDDLYSSFLDIYNNTNDYEKQVQKAQLDFATGKTDDMLAVMMAQEKAYTSLNFAVQVTNKIVSSYQEIMRMQL